MSDETIGGNTLLLPKKLDTLKRRVRSQMPMLRLMRKPIQVAFEKLPTLPAREKHKPGQPRLHIERKTWHYWYDPVDLVTKILSATDLTRRMHFGMACYVDNPIELWHSRAWGSSAMTTSGEFAYTQRGELVLPGDVVRLTYTVEGYTKGRVIFIGKDFRAIAQIQGQVMLTLQPVIR
jgi:hypothetical protein